MEFVRSRRRIVDHGEVFTPPQLVKAMLDFVEHEAERIDSRFLEPACGSGNFLVPILMRKLGVVVARYGNSDFEMRHQGLLAVMSVYGIELLADNVAECRSSLLNSFAARLSLHGGNEFVAAASAVLDVNIVHGDALSMRTCDDLPQPITFAEWSYLGRGRYRRRDFRLDILAQGSDLGEDLLLEDPGKHEIFSPVRDHGVLTVARIAGGGGEG